METLGGEGLPIDSNIIKIESETQKIEDVQKDYYITPELVEEWKHWFLVQKFSLNSLDNYYSILKRYVGYKVILNQKTIDRFREKHMSTVSSAALKSMIKFLVYKKEFPETFLNFRFEKNKQVRKLPKVISPDELDKLVNAMETLRLKIMTKFIYTLALRIEEAVKIKWSDFNWSEWLKDRTQYGKISLTDNKKDKFRVLPVNSVMMEDLYSNHDKSLLDSNGIPREGLVFTDIEKLKECMENPRKDENLTKEQRDDRNKQHFINLETQKFRDNLYKVSKNAIGRRISPHVLRHGRSQWLLDNGTPLDTLKALLGHSTIATTEIYAKASVTKLKEDLEKFDEVGKSININSP